MKYNICMLKKSLLLITLSILLFFSSCSNTQTAFSPLLIEETLRSQINSNQDAIIWSDEIDAHILFEEKDEDDDKDEKESSVFSSNPEFEALIRQAEQMRADAEKLQQQQQEQVGQTGLKSANKTENLYMYVTDSSDSIYPSIPGFGSLDTRAVDDSVTKILNTFFVSLQKGNIAKELFSPKRTYLSAVLEYLFLKYPAPEKWVYGKPFLQENENMNSIEIPVRVWSKQSYYDVWIYISSTGTAEYIDQVQLGSVIVE